MRLAYISPLFWVAAFDRAKRTGVQFGVAFIFAMFGRFIDGGYEPITINLLDMMFWIFTGMLISLFTSILFPKNVLGPCYDGRHKEKHVTIE